MVKKIMGLKLIIKIFRQFIFHWPLDFRPSLYRSLNITIFSYIFLDSNSSHHSPIDTFEISLIFNPWFFDSFGPPYMNLWTLNFISPPTTLVSEHWLNNFDSQNTILVSWQLKLDYQLITIIDTNLRCSYFDSKIYRLKNFIHK